MDKLPNYNGTIDLISGLRAKNNGDFPLMQAHDVQVTEEKRLDEMFESPESWLPTYEGENEGGAEGGGSGGNYTLTLQGESGSLTVEEYQILNDNFPNAIIEYHEGDPIDNPPIYLHSVGNFFGLTFVSLPPIPPDAIQITPYIYYMMFSSNGSGATWQMYKQAYPTATGGGSGSGLTKMKVTLSEIQSLVATLTRGDIIVASLKKAPTLLTSDIMYLATLTNGCYDFLMPFFTIDFEYAGSTQNVSGVGASRSFLVGNTLTTTNFAITNQSGFLFTILRQGGETSDLSEYVTDEYFDFYVYTGQASSGSGSSSGLQIKQITFTDRPSLWTWLQSNYEKAIKTIVTLGANKYDLTENFIRIDVEDVSGFKGSIVQVGVDNNVTEIRFTYIYIADTFITANVGGSIFSIDGTSATVNGANAQIVSDELWTSYGINVTITYIE